MFCFWLPVVNVDVTLIHMSRVGKFPSKSSAALVAVKWRQIIVSGGRNGKQPTLTRLEICCIHICWQKKPMTESLNRPILLGCTVAALSAKQPMERVNNVLQNVATELISHSVHGYMQQNTLYICLLHNMTRVPQFSFPPRAKRER